MDGPTGSSDQLVRDRTGPRSTSAAAGRSAPPARRVAEALRPLIGQFLRDGVPVRFEFWDGSTIEPTAGSPDVPAVVRVRSVDAVRRILWAPGEIGLARAFVAGDLEIEGDIVATLRALREASVGGHLASRVPGSTRRREWRA